MIDRENFADWLENDTTRQVLDALKQQAELLREAAQMQFWHAGFMDTERQMTLAYNKGRALLLKEIGDWQPDDFETLNVERERDKSGW
jgi:hypothetical protein